MIDVGLTGSPEQLEFHSFRQNTLLPLSLKTSWPAFCINPPACVILSLFNKRNVWFAIVCWLLTRLTFQQHASVSQGRICLTSQQHASVSQGRICLTSQQHASVSQGRICLTSQQHASVSQGRICLTSQQHASVSQGRICLTSQQHASVSQGRISSDKCTQCQTQKLSIKLSISSGQSTLTPGQPAPALTQ